MPDKRIPCFDSTTVLGKKFDALYKEGMSEKEQREIGVEIALGEHKKLFEELNTFKEKYLKIKLTKEQKTYVSPDKTKEIQAIHDRYAQKIASEKLKQIGGDDLTLPKIEKDANDIITGKKVFERFSPEEQRGFAEGGANHVEASLILGADEKASRLDNPDTERQESLIQSYAEAKGIWTENTTQELTKKLDKPPFKSGEEASVWRSEDGTKVIKSQSTDMYGGNLQQKLDGITLHNTISEAPLKVIGFGRDAEGNFQVIVEQPFIHADPKINNIHDKDAVAEKTKIKNEYVKKLGFKEDESGNLTNGEVILEDLHNGNVIIDKDKNVIIIDPIMRLNTPEQGYGGTRIIKNEINDNTKEPIKGNESLPPKTEKPVDEKPDSDSGEAKEGIGEPPKPPSEKEAVGDGDVGGITHAANEVRRKDRLLPEYQKEPQSFEQWNNEAEKAIKDGYDVEKLMNEIEGGKDPNPVENAIRKIYIATIDAEIAKNPTDALLAKQKRFIEIGDLANSRAGRNLASLKGEGSPLETISDFYVAKMEAAGVDKLTDQQKTETKEAFDNVQKADANAEAAMEAYREEISRLKAENELLKQKKESKPKKTHSDWVKQRKDALDGAREALRKLRSGESGLLAVPLPGVREFIAIAPHVKNYVAGLLGEGVSNLKEIVSKAYAEFKDILDGITEKDIHNIIAGEYNEKKPTRNELAAKMRDLKDEAYYINKLERLLSGTQPKTEREKVKRNQQISELQKKIKDFLKAEADALKPPKEPKAEKEIVPDELKKLQAIKTRNEKETEKIKERIRKGDFETKKQVPFLDDPEMQRKFPKEYKAVLDAIVKREDTRHEFDIALMKDQMEKRSLGKKGIDLVGDVIGATKALVTGIDASGIGIQNIVAMVAHPRSASKALPGSFADMFSGKTQERWLASVHSSQLFPLAQKAKLDITEPKSLKASEREDIFTHNLLDRRIKFKGKSYVISKYITKPFERLFTGLGNRMRWHLWARGVEKLYEDGYTWESHPEEFKSLAKVLNTETGRGSLHPQIDKAFNLVSAGIWSPRLMASRMNILGLGDIGNFLAGGKKGYYGGLTPRMRLYAAKDFAKFVVFGATLLALMGLAFADEVDLDPNSSTFGTFLINGKRYNIWGGFTQYIRLVAKLVVGGEKSGGEFRESNQLKSGLRFIWSKTTPAVGTGISLLNKDNKDYMGKPVTTLGAAESLLVPLSIRGIAKGVKEEGAGSIIWTGVPSFIGLNVSYESDFADNAEDKKDPVLKYFIDKGAKIPRPNLTSLEIEDEDGKTLKKLSEYDEPKQKEYTDAYQKYLKQEMEDLKSENTQVYVDAFGRVSIPTTPEGKRGKDPIPLDKLTDDQLQDILSELGSSATTSAKKEVFNQ